MSICIKAAWALSGWTHQCACEVCQVELQVQTDIGTPVTQLANCDSTGKVTQPGGGFPKEALVHTRVFSLTHEVHF
jgi:hypothetical protein